MKIRNYLHLFRWPNLVIITLSMILTQWFVVLPLLNIPFAMSLWQFLLLWFAVITITAAGYVINDYFDVDTDLVNKPGKNVVGHLISEKKALNIYYLLSALGIASGALLSWSVGRINFTLIFLFTAGILWYYSERYKCISLLGNITVSVLSAITFGLVWLYDFFALQYDPVLFSASQSGFGMVTKFVFIYMIFAFLSGIFREIVKDVEDRDGDQKVGCTTFVVAYGIKKAKMLNLVTGFFLLGFLFWSQVFFYRLGFYYLFGYFIIMDLLLAFMLKKLHEAGDIVDFSNLSDLSKIFMLLGTLSMALIYFEV